MPVTCILGTQWGDEGKASIIDHLAADTDAVVRFQGGANAGHTVVVGEKKYIFHLVPTGILHPGVKCVLANGVVFDPEEFFAELDTLATEGISSAGRLFISKRAHLVLPYHKKQDVQREEALGKSKIGTTARGIGPAYSDKMSRWTALRVGDLLDEVRFNEKLEAIVKEKNAISAALFGKEEFDFDEILKITASWKKRLGPYITDTVDLLGKMVADGGKILLEGAQGSMLDVDFGTYPFVTSSTTTLAGASAGTGIPPKKINRIIGITKAYTTRVGGGPFPTEETGALGDRLRAAGGEYGATTGRPRRCGWFDLVAVRHAYRISGVSEIALTKLDVLSGLDEIKVCTAYKTPNGTTAAFPAILAEIEAVEPVYETLPGWSEPIQSARTLDALPAAARDYVRFLEDSLGAPAMMVSVGADREELIVTD
jgi:adenylosuccinate synthase